MLFTRSNVIMALLLTLTVLVSGLSVAAGSRSGSKPPPPAAKRTQVIRAETYKAMEASQKAYDAKDYAGAAAALDVLKAKEDKLNDYERATLYNLYAVIYYAQGSNAKAIDAYIQVLKQPNLPEGLRDSSLYAMGQLYFLSGDYPRAVKVIQKWLSVVAEPSPEGNALLAQAYYQMENYPEAEKALIASMKISKERNQTPKEPALALLRAIYFERKQYDKAAKVLEILVSAYPDKSSYWQQLAGMYGLLDRQKEQTYVLHVAHRADLLSNENDLLNVARLYLLADAPYPAIQVLISAFKAKAIKLNVENLQLLAQAQGLSREYRQQVPVLTKLAEMSGESRHYVYLGQAYDELADWNNAIAAYRAALKAKKVDNPANIQMALGTALFNASKLSEAREAFVEASTSESLKDTAGNWVKFVDSEIARKEASAGL